MTQCSHSYIQYTCRFISLSRQNTPHRFTLLLCQLLTGLHYFYMSRKCFTKLRYFCMSSYRIVMNFLVQFLNCGGIFCIVQCLLYFLLVTTVLCQIGTCAWSALRICRKYYNIYCTRTAFIVTLDYNQRCYY